MASTDTHNGSGHHDLTSDTPETPHASHYEMDPSMPMQSLPMQQLGPPIPNQFATYVNPMVPMQPLQPIQPVSVPPPDFAVPVPNPPNATAATSNTTPPKTLWMGDLDPWSDEEAIMNLWALLGKRVLVKLIKAKKGTPAASLNTGHAGYCFIEFETFEDAKDALTLNGTNIANTNRLFRLNWASGATLTSTIPQSAEYSLFVGDLAPTTTEAHLLALFQSHFNSVKTVRVMTDPITGTSRCFGFVRFSDEEERSRALNTMNGMWCLGRPLRVALATPRSQALNALPNSGQLSHYTYDRMSSYANPSGVYQQVSPQPGLKKGDYVYSPAQYPGQYDPDFAMQQISQDFHAMNLSPNPEHLQSQHFHIQQGVFTDPKNTTVFIGGLAPGILEPTLAQVFQPFGKILHVKIPQGKGCGFIRFERREDAENAISGMQGFQIGGSRIRLSWGRQQQNQQNSNQGFFNGSRSQNVTQNIPNYSYNGNMSRSGVIPITTGSSAGYPMSPEIPFDINDDHTQGFSASSYDPASSFQNTGTPEPFSATTNATSDFQKELKSEKNGKSEVENVEEFKEGNGDEEGNSQKTGDSKDGKKKNEKEEVGSKE